MSIELNHVYNENCLSTLSRMDNNFVDLIVTSPPYDSLRSYKGYSFDFESVARELFRVLKPGGVVVWVVGDQTVDGSESGTSFRQALFFKEIGFNLHDTMLYAKDGPPLNDNRYQQEFEYMFVFSKGKPKTFTPILIESTYGNTKRMSNYHRANEGGFKVGKPTPRIRPNGMKLKGNIWHFICGGIKGTSDVVSFKHPATFPEQLTHDHIVSWSLPGDLVFDPFSGSGTTLKMAKFLNRNYLGSEISAEYCAIIEERLKEKVLEEFPFFSVEDGKWNLPKGDLKEEESFF